MVFNNTPNRQKPTLKTSVENLCHGLLEQAFPTLTCRRHSSTDGVLLPSYSRCWFALERSKNPKNVHLLRNSHGTSLARVQLRILSPTSPSFSPEMLDLCYNHQGACYGNNPNTFQRRRQLSLGTLGRADNGLMQLGAKDSGGGGGGGQDSPDQEQGGQHQDGGGGPGAGSKRWSNPGPTRGDNGRAGLRLVLPTVVIAAPTPYDNCNR